MPRRIGTDGTVLEVCELGVTFATTAGPLEAAHGVSFELSRGRTLGLVGESGCGKTVTALALLGLVPPPGRITGGQILLAGTDLASLPERNMEAIRGNRLSMIFQEPATALNPVFTAGEQVAEVLRRHRGVNREAARNEAIAALDRVGIADAPARAAAYPHQLSGGMRQRVMIAMALACNPEVLIADEPTTALDVTVQSQIIDLMLQAQETMGMAMLFISHNLGVISEVADDVAVMYAGRIVELADAESLFAAPLHPYTRGLIETLPHPGRRGGRPPTIPGTVPDLRALPPGCPFSNRCPLADDGCREREPSLIGVPGDRQVSCFKAET